MDARAHFATLARYNQWATRRLLEAVAELGDVDYRRNAGLFFRSVHGTLNHLLVAEHELWFVRFAEGRSPRVQLDMELEPDRARLAERLQRGAAHWLALIAGWAAERFDGKLQYTTMRGTQSRCRLPRRWPMSSITARIIVGKSRLR